MMSLLVFLVLLFGVLGIFVSQYMVTYRRAYSLWINECVYSDDGKKKDFAKKRAMCCKIESYCREICGLVEIIQIIAISIAIMGLSIVLIIRINLPIIDNNDQVNIMIMAQWFTVLLMVVLIYTLYYAHINILYPSKTSSIDEKLFLVWYNHRCFENKRPSYINKLEPSHLYEILAKWIDDGKIIPTAEERELVKSLLKKDVNSNP